jgi:hypothetical protein
VTITPAPDKDAPPIVDLNLFSAIDTALENNQVRGVQLILDHIVNYQNSYVSFTLFRGILGDLMSKGLVLEPLLSSDIFYKKLEFEDWPSAHSCLDKILVPYNGSLFEMRYNYDEIYPTLGDPINEEAQDGEQKAAGGGSSTFYSIAYRVNLLPSVLTADDLDLTAADTSKDLLDSILE